jgi:pimeloyl-ACP methyl ester carboxylesterase
LAPSWPSYRELAHTNRLACVQGEPTSGLVLREWGDPGLPGILLWPGLGSTGAYFAGIAGALPGRAVAVDPPGFGGSAPLEPCTFEGLVDVARATVSDRRCTTMVGHSLGAYVALGVGCEPPDGLRAIVLIDGGFLTALDFVALGMPVLSGRTELVAWMQPNALRFPDWETVTRELARMETAEITPSFEAYVHEVMVDNDGEVRAARSSEQLAEPLLATLKADVLALGSALKVPALLIACGQPLGRRPVKEKAWQDFVAVSPLVELHVENDWSHNPVLQDPEVLASLIGAWLRAIG